MTYTGDRERLFCEIKCGVYQVQLFFCIFSQSFSISSISFFPGLDTDERHLNVGHMTCYRVRNIPAQLCYAPDDSQLFGALVLMHPLPQYTLVSYRFLSYSSMFSFIRKLPFSASWNFTLKSFKNEVIRDGYSCCCCCCCFISFLTSSFYCRCFFLFLFLFFFYLSPLFFFNTLL